MCRVKQGAQRDDRASVIRPSVIIAEKLKGDKPCSSALATRNGSRSCISTTSPRSAESDTLPRRGSLPDGLRRGGGRLARRARLLVVTSRVLQPLGRSGVRADVVVRSAKDPAESHAPDALRSRPGSCSHRRREWGHVGDRSRRARTVRGGVTPWANRRYLRRRRLIPSGPHVRARVRHGSSRRTPYRRSLWCEGGHRPWPYRRTAHRR